MKKLADISAFEHIQSQANRDMGLVSDMAVFNRMGNSDLGRLIPQDLLYQMFQGVHQYAKKLPVSLYLKNIDKAFATAYKKWCADNQGLMENYKDAAFSYIEEKYPTTDDSPGSQMDSIERFCRSACRKLEVPETFNTDAARDIGDAVNNEIMNMPPSWERNQQAQQLRYKASYSEAAALEETRWTKLKQAIVLSLFDLVPRNL